MLIFSILKEIFFFLPEKTAVGQWWHENEKKCNYKNKYFSIYLVKKSTLFWKKNSSTRWGIAVSHQKILKNPVS